MTGKWPQEMAMTNGLKFVKDMPAEMF